MAKAEPRKGAARQRVLERRLLAQKIRKAEHPVAAGRHCGGKRVESRMRLPSPASELINPASQFSAEPDAAMQPFGAKRPGTR